VVALDVLRGPVPRGPHPGSHPVGVLVRGHDRRHWGAVTNERWLWTFPIIFPIACVVLLPVAIVYSLFLAVRWLAIGR
jgi:hypothetical protein